MTPGQNFVKTWQIKNTGTCTWAAGYTLVYGYGEKMNGKAVALTSDVAPGGTTEVSVNLTAPSKAGNYTAAWRMANANGYPFGAFVTVVIAVK
jgi:methionine-rich copper-binding protein CopC